MMNNNKFSPIIGLEVHVELKTKSKMFCGCSADYFGKKPNTHVCPVCLGLPGALPVPNKKAIEWCVMIGLALNCKIPLVSKFDRKNYFYPDLPKGYQISQYDEPFCVNGWIDIKSQITNHKSQINSKLKTQNSKKIRIRRVHMEEDTAKLIHQFETQNSKLPPSSRLQRAGKTQNYEGSSLIDFNRSGVPLVEIVTEPDFRSTNEVIEYLKKLQQIVRYLGVSDADMEKGEMRLEPNISLRLCLPELGSGIKMAKQDGYQTGQYHSARPSPEPTGSGTVTRQVRHDNEILPNYKVEVKNINSFKFVEKSINYEIERQKKMLEEDKIPLQETRGWDSEKQITVVQRVKEEAMDYRYFPEPDIPPILFTKSQISNLKSQIPEMPDEKRLRFQKEYGLSEYDSEILTREKSIADYFEEAVKVNHELRIRNKEITDAETIANWIINKKVDIEKILPAQVIKDILRSTKKESIDTYELNKIIAKVVLDNPKAISDYKKGKKNAIMFLVGCVVKQIKKKIDVKIVKDNLENKLSSL